VWESEVGGKKLTFHLAGINNQNFIMRDDETGSWWQQVSGEAIQGPLKGKKLTQVYNDELTFALWKREIQQGQQGRVLKPDQRVKQNYEAADWEEQYAKLRVVTPVDPHDKLPPRALLAGIAVNGKGRPIHWLPWKSNGSYSTASVMAETRRHCSSPWEMIINPCARLSAQSAVVRSNFS
jgi:uncharacterized protein DUF3179